ncbi:hypothetical protein [Bremerella volcania]|uniref:hypothetical protein n=1 Tax=Bremerella volcania TaxID=2527984 RepID=UPI0011A9979A|nr:hypothetical protein [Bremerella volcania]
METLLGEGRASVPALGPIPVRQKAAAVETLARYERLWRRECPSPIPDYHPDAANWAAEQFCLACQFAIFRDVDEQTMRAALTTSLESDDGPDVHYSVDLVFRFLPDLVKFVHAASSDDPLESILRGWALRWPLSSVGLPGIEVAEIDHGVFYQSSGLMSLYVDRIVTCADRSRLIDDVVREHVLAAVGMYPDLAPHLALNEYLTENGEMA